MRLLLADNVQNAWNSLRSTRARTFLTTIGVAIGVGSITLVLSLSTGITSIVSNQVKSLGNNIAVVRPTTASQTIDGLTDPIAQPNYTVSSITEQDLDSIKSLSNVDQVAPLMLINGSVKSSGASPSDTSIVATSPELQSIANLSLSSGQFIDNTTDMNTAVIGAQLAIDLFGTDTPLGQSFTIRGQPYTVIGVLNRQNIPLNFNSVDFDNAAIIKLDNGKAFNQGIAQLQQIDVRAKTIADLPGVIKGINRVMSRNHQGQRDYSVISGKEIAQPTSELFSAVTAVITAVAAISLVVGGIGIMNIMLVSVAERTREIGLRKSLGASNGNVVLQFMIEALIMCLIGGLVGYIGGYVVAYGLATTILPFYPAFNWTIAVVALVMSVGVGVIFGLYPAVRAARKDPIESLRQYH